MRHFQHRGGSQGRENRVHAQRDSALGRTMVALALTASMMASAQAGCWRDAGLEQRTHAIAQRHFPRVVQQMPDIVACSADMFPPGIGGDYQGGAHLIRIPHWQLNGSELNAVIAHELAHAQVALTGGDMHTAGGHGPDFLRVLVQAGFRGEAQRVAEYTGQRGLIAQADPPRELPAAPPAPPPLIYVPPRVIYVQPRPPVVVTHCMETPVTIYVPFRGGWGVRTHIQRTCWNEVY